MPRKKTAASARRNALAALRTESDRQLEELIRRRQLPVAVAAACGRCA